MEEVGKDLIKECITRNKYQDILIKLAQESDFIKNTLIDLTKEACNSTDSNNFNYFFKNISKNINLITSLGIEQNKELIIQAINLIPNKYKFNIIAKISEIIELDDSDDKPWIKEIIRSGLINNTQTLSDYQKELILSIDEEWGNELISTYL